MDKEYTNGQKTSISIIKRYLEDDRKVSLNEYSKAINKYADYGYLALRKLKDIDPELYEKGLAKNNLYSKHKVSRIPHVRYSDIDFSIFKGKKIRKPDLIDWYISLGQVRGKDITCGELFETVKNAGAIILEDFYG